jgi:hypothetical protein
MSDNHKLELFAAVKIQTLLFRVVTPRVLYVDNSVSDKHTASIFRTNPKDQHGHFSLYLCF